MNSQTLLFRQIHPSWIQQGRATSQAFTPTQKDATQLSVYDGDQITAEESWKHYTDILGLNSYGTLAITISECNNVQLSVIPDPNPFPEHAYIDFGGLSGNQIKNKSKYLRSVSNSRGWVFLP
jgi:hypothetical protein